VPFITLREPVYVQIQNLSSRALVAFGRSIQANQIQAIPVSLDDPQDSSWNALINALKAGTAKVGFPGTGGLAERLVEAALRSAVGVEALLTLQETVLVANTAAETTFLQYPLERDFWLAGVGIRVRAGGIVSAATGTQPTVRFRLRLAADLLLSTGSITLTSNTADAPWWFEATLLCRQVGTAGQIMINGQVFLAAGGKSAGLANPGVGFATVDLSQRRDLKFTAQWGAANAANICQLQNMTIERLPPSILIGSSGTILGT
jgi:hypothetical protein